MRLAALLFATLPIWSQAVPAPPAQAIPVGLPPDAIKAIQDAQVALAKAAAAATPPVQPAAPSLPPEVVKAIQAAIATAAANTVTTVVPPTSCPGEAAQFFSVGGGINGLGPSQLFGYFSASQHIACGTWATQISEFARMPGGLVGNSTRAGVSKELWKIGALHLGIVGDAGAAEGATGSLSGALAARVYGVLPIAKSSWHIVVTAEDLKIAGTGSQTVISLGIGYGVK